MAHVKYFQYLNISLHIPNTRSNMLANSNTLLLCLGALFASAYASSNPKADKHCQERQGPNWEAKLDASGKVIGCQETTVKESCFKAYKNPATGEWECCPVDKPFTPLDGDDPFGLGACCAPEEVVQVDQEQAGCCPEGKIWKWNSATNSGSCNDPPQPDCNKSPSNCAIDSPCANKNICPCNGLGIQYGKCYTLQDTNGLQLGREINGAGIYRSGAEINNIVFRVCKSVDDCSADQGKEVLTDGKWLMQDQLGTSYTPGYAWWGNGEPHMGATTTTTLAASFTGELYCYNGQCGVCMRQASPRPGLNAPCPMPGQEAKVHIGVSANPMNCKAYFYQQTPCFKGPPAEGKAEM